MKEIGDGSLSFIKKERENRPLSPRKVKNSQNQAHPLLILRIFMFIGVRYYSYKCRILIY